MAEARFERMVSRLTYAARQGGRVAWYAGHGAVMRRMVRRIEAGLADADRPKIAKPRGPVPAMSELLRDVGALLARDLANIEAGYYPPPAGGAFDPRQAIRESRAFLRDVPAVARRRREHGHGDVHRNNQTGNQPADPEKRPRYYMQNFHFQSGGWMTDQSAQIYDMQVEVLFSGAANAMRRQALVPLARAIAGHDQRHLRHADIACGTGVFLTEVARAFPRLPQLAIELSEPYLHHALGPRAHRNRVNGLVGKAEALPLADASLDMATVIYLFHELPPKIRTAVAGELGRVIKPGGTLVMIDSLQPGNDPGKDGLLELFPQMFHEPYFRSYLTTDFDRLFANAGFEPVTADNAFLSRVLHYRKVV